MNDHIDIIRATLIKESGQKIDLGEYLENELGKSRAILIEGGFAIGHIAVGCSDQGKMVKRGLMTEGLTDEGYRLADLLRDEVRYKKVKAYAQKKGITLTLNNINELYARPSLWSCCFSHPLVYTVIGGIIVFLVTKGCTGT